MRTVRARVDVPVPPERAWALYADLDGTPRWVPFVEEILEASGPLEVGMTYRERTRLLGARAVNTWRVVGLVPGRRRIEESHDMGMDSVLVITFTPLRGGTRIRQVAHLASRLPGPIGRAHELMAAVGAQHGLRGAVAGAVRELAADTRDAAG